MNIRETSIETFNKIQTEGLLSRMRMEVYGIIFTHGPLTANQIVQKAKDENPNRPQRVLESLHKRLSELLRLGVVREVGTVLCPISGRMVIQWDIVDSALPNYEVKLKKEKCPHCDGRGHV